MVPSSCRPGMLAIMSTSTRHDHAASDQPVERVVVALTGAPGNDALSEERALRV
jgi:hypothetical protein